MSRGELPTGAVARMAVYTCRCPYGLQFSKGHAVTLEQDERGNAYKRCLLPLMKLGRSFGHERLGKSHLSGPAAILRMARAHMGTYFCIEKSMRRWEAVMNWSASHS